MKKLKDLLDRLWATPGATGGIHVKYDAFVHEPNGYIASAFLAHDVVIIGRGKTPKGAIDHLIKKLEAKGIKL